MHAFVALSFFALLCSSSALAAVIPTLRTRRLVQESVAPTGILKSIGSSSSSVTLCNGHAELCNRSYGNVTFFGSHDSFAFSAIPFALSRTQEVDIPTQLSLGVRMLQAQAHIHDGVLHFCHTRFTGILGCLLFNGGTVVDYLKDVKVFLDANPHEVITFIFTNPEMVSVSDVWKPAFDAASITPMAYVPPSLPVARSDWPTLGEMISTNKRVIVFLDKGANGTAGEPVDFILPQFDMVWEDPYSSTNKDFPCHVDRIHGSLSVEDHANMINHNLNTNLIPIGNGILISDRADAPTTNSIHSIMAHANGCTPYAGGRAPNFVLLDYVNVGHGREAVDLLNGF